MKVLMLSTDNKIFEEGSAVRKRMAEYGRLFRELHLVVFTTRKFQIPTNNFQTNSKIQISNNVWIYPTNSRFKIFSFWDAYKIGKEIILNSHPELDSGSSLKSALDSGFRQNDRERGRNDREKNRNDNEKDWVITAQDAFETGLAGYLLKFRLKIPLQIQIHTDFLSHYFWAESLKNKIRVLLAKFLIKRADGIRVVSKRIKDSLLTLYPIPYTLNPITVLPIFVDTKKIQSAPIKTDLHKKYPGRDFIILMASRLTREKNIVTAIEAMAGIVHNANYAKSHANDAKLSQNSHKVSRHSHYNPLLIIVGEGPEKMNYELRIKNYGLENNVIIEPWTNDLASYYKSADLFLLTSNYEGYGMSVVEAMAAGLPVIMTDVGLAGEVVENGKNGTVVPVGDSLALKEAINKAIQNRKARKSRVALRPAQGVSPLGEFISKRQYLENYREALHDILPKPKLCYVLPKFNPEDSTHFVYLHDFLKVIAKVFSISLLVEKGDLPGEDFGYKEARIVKSAFAPLRITETFFKLILLRIKGNRDFYVHYSFGAAFLAGLIIKVFGGRVFYWNCGEPWKYRRNFLRDWFERLVYKQVNLVTGTEGLKVQYAKHYNIPLEKILVMANWINLKNFQFPIFPPDFAWTKSRRAGNFQKNKLKKELNIKPDDKIILFVHRLSKRKGAHHLPEILRQLHNANYAKPNANDAKVFSQNSHKVSQHSHYDPIMLIVGEGPERENIELKIKNYGLLDKVRFLGAVPNYQLPDYYSLADVFIMPSEEEGFPHVLLEAMAFGVPFVATNVGGVNDIVPKAAHNLIVPPADPEKFAKKVLQIILKTKRERQTMGRLLKEWVKRYDIMNSAEQFRKIITND